MNTELAPQTQESSAIQQQSDEMSVKTVLSQVAKVQQVMKHVMKAGEHYGQIPGCGDKPSLLKPGAEKLAFTFRLAPRFAIERLDFEGGHREYIVTCDLCNINTGAFVGSGVGSCSTMEAKYRFRSEDTGRPVPQDYWETRDPKILGGPQFHPRKKNNAWTISERIEHDNPADYYNTVLKMAKKRANVDATLTATAASDIFTQDIDDDDLASTDKTRSTTNGNGAQPTVQQPRRRSDQNGTQAQTAPRQPGDAREELMRLCVDIANAGMTAASEDYKTFALVRSDSGDTPDGICIKLSTFPGRDQRVIPGKSIAQLSDKAVHVTLKKAKEVHGQLADATSQVGGPMDDDAALDAALAKESPTAYICRRCSKPYDHWPESGKCSCLGELTPAQSAA